MHRLKPCPFCGDAPGEVIHHIGQGAIEKSEENATNSWNARAAKKHYEDYEFCWSMRCKFIDRAGCTLSSLSCSYGAKKFHQWLDENGYEIIKKRREADG